MLSLLAGCSPEEVLERTGYAAPLYQSLDVAEWVRELTGLGGARVLGAAFDILQWCDRFLDEDDCAWPWRWRPGDPRLAPLHDEFDGIVGRWLGDGNAGLGAALLSRLALSAASRGGWEPTSQPPLGKVA